jgi:hypothetical protein
MYRSAKQVYLHLDDCNLVAHVKRARTSVILSTRCRALGTLLGTCTATARTAIAERTAVIQVTLDSLRKCGGAAVPKPPTQQQQHLSSGSHSSAPHGRKVPLVHLSCLLWLYLHHGMHMIPSISV